MQSSPRLVGAVPTRTNKTAALQATPSRSSECRASDRHSSHRRLRGSASVPPAPESRRGSRTESSRAAQSSHQSLFRPPISSSSSPRARYHSCPYLRGGAVHLNPALGSDEHDRLTRRLLDGRGPPTVGKFAHTHVPVSARSGGKAIVFKLPSKFRPGLLRDVLEHVVCHAHYRTGTVRKASR